MRELWTAEFAPPQVSPRGQEAMTEVLLDGDVPSLVNALEPTLFEKHAPLGDYVARLGFEMCQAYDGPWPYTVLRFSATIALQAYQESGFDQVVDEEAVQVGAFSASLEGVPYSYFLSFVQDPGLQTVIDLAYAKPEFHEEEKGYKEVLDIGAGCARHYLKSALEAA